MFHSEQPLSSSASSSQGSSDPTATVINEAASSAASADGSELELHLPGYVLTQKLGQGAYGQVWQAVRLGAGQEVAVKIFTSPGKLDWRYLQREVDRLLRVAEHPHIVTLLDANLHHQPPFYTMTLLRSGSLAAICKKDRPYLDINQAVRWFEQLVQALTFAHGKSLLHCDIKPANVLLDEEGNARLVDFGQSQLRGEAANTLGTLNFMAPEQAIVANENETPPDPSVSWDIYGLGATLYCLLAGQPPHTHPHLQSTLTSAPDVASRLAQYRQYLLSTPIIPLRRLNPAVDQDLADIIEHCLHPQADQRYENIGEIEDDLLRRRAIRPLHCRPLGHWGTTKKFIRRNLGMIVVVTVALIAIAVISITNYINLQEERTRLVSERKEVEARLLRSEQKNDDLQNRVEQLESQLKQP